MSKVSLADRRIAGDFLIYIDDIQSSASMADECWQVSRRIASICSHLEIQDAAQKRRPRRRSPGAWAGSIIQTKGDVIFIAVDQKKWDKMRKVIQWVRNELSLPDGTDQKQLESVSGFLIYVTHTYPAMMPYLKGICHTLGGW